VTTDKASRRRHADALRDVADELDPPKVDEPARLAPDVEDAVDAFARSPLGQHVGKVARAVRVPGVRGRPKSRAPTTKADARLLSARDVARFLRVRRETVALLILTRQIRTVEVNGRPRIPATEVDRLTREGFDVARSSRRRR
jgi:hypothetical protein